MDAAASQKVEAGFKNVHVYLQFENVYPTTTVNQRNTVIKYTKLPDCNFSTRESWPRNSYTLPPRLRRIIELGDEVTKANLSLKSYAVAPERIIKTNSQIIRTSRSQKYGSVASQRNMSSNRKIVTIAEDDENDLHPKFSRDIKKSSQNKAVATDYDRAKEREKTISRLTSPKTLKNTKPGAKSNNLKDVSVSKMNYKSNQKSSSNQNISTTQNSNEKYCNIKEKETSRNIKSSNVSSRTSFNKPKSQPENEVDLDLRKNNLIDDLNSNFAPKKTNRISKVSKPLQKTKSKTALISEIKNKNKPVSIIQVPLEVQNRKSLLTETEIKDLSYDVHSLNKVDCGIGTYPIVHATDMNVETETQSEKVNKMTEITKLDFESTDKYDKFTEIEKSDFETSEKVNKMTEMDKFGFETFCNNDLRMDVFKEFDSLDVPNVTLIKDKSDISKDLAKLCSQSLPNLQVPTLKMSPPPEDKNKDLQQVTVCNSSSYIIGRATLTYTTKQKINFQVVGKNEQTVCKVSSPLAYPMNVVSIFKKEIENREICDVSAVDCTQKEKTSVEYSNYLNEIKSLNCSYVLDSSKLVKPSDIISTIRVNNDLLQSDYICEQFQRELNFIDSFFESLQYLESCSLSDKCFKDNKVENWVCNSGFDIKNPEFDSLFSKIGNGADNDDSETMASKSLCLLNLLIRDEQRRAKNLLFVLKMREDALKDFTKSQILWLENKKKQDNTDITTLKKKQRGALLKLQHECGEMQRMRKALLALSEKRKVALMKTKKNIELKLKNNVSVEQIVLGKKKIKRNTAADRNTAPLKCFDLSSSGCDEITLSRARPDAIIIPEVAEIHGNTNSAEKSIQTGDSVLETICIGEATATATDNCIAVDGTYLNILFHNLSWPQIFSSGIQYEVNEKALTNIVMSSNTHSNFNDGDVIEKFMDQIKKSDIESSTPSTARSLVEEFDQYYKVLAEEERSSTDSADRDYTIPVRQEFDQVFTNEAKFDHYETCSRKSDTVTSDSADTVFDRSSDMNDDQSYEFEVESHLLKDLDVKATQAGPLPVPEGAFTEVEPNTAVSLIPKSTMCPDGNAIDQCLTSIIPPMSCLASPVHCEAEELRRQQLAIEREIKALEQQQCHLLVVRAIPDKPPPPYTPPADARVRHAFTVDNLVEQQIHRNITHPTLVANDPFELFVEEYCQETVNYHKSRHRDKPWDTCYLLAQKPHYDQEQLVKKATSDLKDILAGVTPTSVSGVGARRSDHIDDILFSEWRSCEPQWTSLHSDEAIVKNQIFESIFQKILTETIDEYKKTVPHANDVLSE